MLENFLEGAMVGLEGGQDLRVEMLRLGAAIALSDDVVSLVVTEGRLVGPLTAQSIILIDQVEDAALDRDRLSLQPLRVASTVPALVMAEGKPFRTL